MSHTFFIGDIHGCFDELAALYVKMNIQEGDIVYATGDLINGGGFSQKVVQFLLEHNIMSVLGNHDVAFLEGLQDPSKCREWHGEVAQQFLEYEAGIDYLKNLPYWIESDDFLLVHAGIVPDVPIEKQETDNLIKIRMHKGKPWHTSYHGTKKIVYGHWAEQGLRITHNTVGIDSGCVWGGHLTGYCLETGEIWQCLANTVYKIPNNWKGKMSKI